MKLWWFLLLVAVYLSSVTVFCHEGNSAFITDDGQHGKRVKREWLWNQIFVPEEQMLNLPYHIGKISSDTKKTNVKYALQGEYANSIFKVNENNGDILCFARLDREKKDLYKLTALLVDRSTNKTLEPPSSFYIKVLDINDNAPEFTKDVFYGYVNEMSNTRTLVTNVTAFDADDPTVGGNAKVTYRLIKGQEYFLINNTGFILTATSDLDREQKATYELIVEAKDSPDQKGGLSSTATVIVTLLDINDNFPTFKDKQYTFNVPENLAVGGVAGKMVVEDIDEPQNRNTTYSFIKEKFQEMFSVITSAKTNEGILVIKKPLDFESVQQHKFSVEATDPKIDLRMAQQFRPKSIAEVIINVLDVDEPPVFSKPFYQFQVNEDTVPQSTIIGFVSAKDPDAANRQVKYRIRDGGNIPITVKENSGNIINSKPLDRETNAWYNLTIEAEEIDPSNPPIKKVSLARVYIKVLDVNDNAPEFAEPYEPKVCENAAQKTVIINISATDKDEMIPGMKFTYHSARMENNFTVRDNHDNTASIIVKYGQFNRDVAKVHYLPIVTSDNGQPVQSSTNTLTITICRCNEKGEFTLCEEIAKQASVSVPTLVIIFVTLFLLILVVTILLILKRTQKTNTKILSKNVAEIHEQLVTYDEEGGGEMDTNSYDVSVLNSVRRNVSRPRPDMEPGPCMYAQVQKPHRNGDMNFVIEVKKDEADNDGEMLPYDTLHIFGYEGSESIVESLSSLDSGSSDSDIDYDVLNEWGPRFKMLADLYGLESIEGFTY
ncbi:cadherin-5 [Bombina bombina]|uniref:cadherin-5 n=1 Tax=Bombina bombina TaxID=8345 RepID=UPI00235AA33A|nr:cadherin-5 [Bombina bombina]